LERNWRQWKGGQQRGRRTLETVEEEEEINQENSAVREWTKEDKEEMGNIVDLYYKL